MCKEPAFGKVVQCRTCGEWFHYECLNIDDSAIDTLREDDLYVGYVQTTCYMHRGMKIWLIIMIN